MSQNKGATPHDLVFNFDGRLHREFAVVFGKATADRFWEGGESFVNTVKESLLVHVDKGRLAYAMNRVADLVRKLEPHRGPIID
ncbi:MAG: hypothetical protein M3Y27_22305 [Acidobacteriota bacterium]|nr:hypothetical protein [Acidobacteriota bacterium]